MSEPLPSDSSDPATEESSPGVRVPISKGHLRELKRLCKARCPGNHAEAKALYAKMKAAMDELKPATRVSLLTAMANSLHQLIEASARLSDRYAAMAAKPDEKLVDRLCQSITDAGKQEESAAAIDPSLTSDTLSVHCQTDSTTQPATQPA